MSWAFRTLPYVLQDELPVCVVISSCQNYAIGAFVCVFDTHAHNGKSPPKHISHSLIYHMGNLVDKLLPCAVAKTKKKMRRFTKHTT